MLRETPEKRISKRIKKSYDCKGSLTPLLDSKYKAVGIFGLINYHILQKFVSQTLCKKEAVFKCKKLWTRNQKIQVLILFLSL